MNLHRIIAFTKFVFHLYILLNLMDNNIKISKYQCSQNKKDYFLKMLSLLLYRKNKKKI